MKRIFCTCRLIIAGIGVAVLPSFADTIDAALFPHSVTIQFDGCTAATPLENFPVPVKLSASCPVGFSYADCAVDSFRFTDIDGNVLAHDVESWNPDGTSVVWVSVPALVKDAAIFFCYGAAAASLPANNASDVWTRAGYVGVWHMNETTGTVPDAAGNNLTASPMGRATSVDGTSGLIGGARGVIAATGEHGHFSVPNYDALALGSDFTISAWVKMTAGNTYSRIFSRKSYYTDNDGWEIEMNNGSTTAFTARAATNDKNIGGSFPDLTADWRLVQLAYSGSTLTIYADGAQIKTGTINPANIDNGKPLSFGSDSNGDEASFFGLYDEVRLRRGSPTLAWQQMEIESARKADFAKYSIVDQTFGNVVAATAGAGGLVRLGDGDAATTVMTESVDLGTTLTATITAVPNAGYRFRRWICNASEITSGTIYSPTITVTTQTGSGLAAEFASLTDGSCIEITNAFDNPSGGFMSSVVGSALQVSKPTVIFFTAPEDAPSGLREFYANIKEDVRCDWKNDWGFQTSFSVASSASTQSGIQFAGTETSVANKTDVYTYAGSWYVPADATYSFRMNMKGAGQLVIDNRIILQQKSDAALVTTNGVSLAAGWHNLFVVLTSSSASKVGPAIAGECGLLYSASNDDLAVTPQLGHPFEAETGENAHRLSTAFNGVLVPSVLAGNGDVIIDCANALGDLRVGGVLVPSNNKFIFANMKAGSSLELGRPIKVSWSTHGVQNMNGFAWIDWERTELPAGVNVRFVGAAAMLSPLPAGHDWSFGGSVSLATSIPDFFGVVASDADEFRLPDEIEYLIVGTPKVLGDKAEIRVGKGQMFSFSGGKFGVNNGPAFVNSAATFKNNVDLTAGGRMNGTPDWDANTVWEGNITGGDSGFVSITGWGRRINLTGSVNVSEGRTGQLGCRVNVRPAEGSAPSHFGYYWISAEGGTSDQEGYAAPTLFYCPQGENQPPLSIGELDAAGAYVFPERPKNQRSGSTISTCSNNTVNVTSLIGKSLNLRTHIPKGANGASDAELAGSTAGNFTFGSINAAMTLYVSSNVNITVTNVVKAATFDYSVQSGGVNDAVLDIEGECTPSTLKATDVAMLPARVKGFVGNVTLTETAAKTYPTVIDFDKPAPVHGGCDGSGTLVAAPLGGAFEVTFAGEPVAGDYGLARFTGGGELLSGWTVSAPANCGGHSVKVMKDSTGIWLSIRKGGFVVIIR